MIPSLFDELQLLAEQLFLAILCFMLAKQREMIIARLVMIFVRNDDTVRCVFEERDQKNG